MSILYLFLLQLRGSLRCPEHFCPWLVSKGRGSGTWVTAWLLPVWSGFYAPMKAELRAPHSSSSQPHLDASWALRREMLSCLLKITFMSSIAGALEFRGPACWSVPPKARLSWEFSQIMETGGKSPGYGPLPRWAKSQGASLCMKGAFAKKKLPWKGSSIYLVLEDSTAYSLNSDWLPCPSVG